MTAYPIEDKSTPAVKPDTAAARLPIPRRRAAVHTSFDWPFVKQA